MSVIKRFFEDYLLVCNSISECKEPTPDYRILAAVIIAEDRMFLSHKGVSLPSLARAFIKQYGGASTIEMQLVRTLTNRREISISRKVREIILSVLVSLRFNKIEILSMYLNVAYFGSGLNGYMSVIKDFLMKNYGDDLTDYQCCVVASMLKRPYSNSCHSKMNSLRQRANYVYSLYGVMGEAVIGQIKEYLLQHK